MRTTIEIEDFYSYSYRPQRRYGGEEPAHRRIESLLADRQPTFDARLREFARLSDDFLRVSRDQDDANPQAPYWVNGFLPGLDAVSLYGFITTRRPSIYCEIGSGHSTRFAYAAKRAHSPGTAIISIDPEPRSEITQLCDTVMRTPLQDCDLGIFDRLQPGDVLFIDGSHRVLQNSDVSVFFLDVLPSIKPGVLIHLHDIFWPFDYPTEWAARMYSEQYMLGLLLVFGATSIDILLANAYIAYCTNLTLILDELWRAPHLAGIERHGCSFWFSKR
jgi:hypothetical protein